MEDCMQCMPEGDDSMMFVDKFSRVLLKVEPAGTCKIYQLPLLRSLPVTCTELKVDFSKIMLLLEPAFGDLMATIDVHLICADKTKEPLLPP